MSIKPGVGLFLLVIIVAMPLFAHLDELPLSAWDEARLANNALEMLHNHNWLVTYYGDAPDAWSSKPPLMIWAQVLMMKVVGVNELAVRLPSALAGLGTCLMLFFFFTKKYKEPILGLLCVGVLITAQGYIGSHSTRNGDYDALLTMFMTGYCLSFFLFLEDGKQKFLYATFVCITLAALTKGIQAFLLIPPLFVYALYKKKISAIVRQPGLYIGICASMFVVIGYYVLREQYNPGYIKAVWENEIGGRYGDVIEGHNGSPWFYCNALVNVYFHEWYAFAIPAVLVGIFNKQKWIKDLTVFLAVLITSYLVIISNSQTKLIWYLVPVYPFLAVLVANFIFTIYSALLANDYLKHSISVNVLPLLFLIIVFLVPYTLTLNKVLSPVADLSQTAEERDYGSFLRDAIHNRNNNDNLYILNAGQQQDFFWYYRVLAYQHRPLKLIGTMQLAPGMIVIPYGAESRKYLEDSVHAVPIWRQSTLYYYKM